LSVSALVVAAAGDASAGGWIGIIVAALGSSAIGAVVGGLITTWLGGRIQREEAWRTRLIEAADDLGCDLAEALLEVGRVIGEAERFGLAIREAGKPTGAVIQRVAEVRTKINRGRVRLSRVGLLFGADSPTYDRAVEVVNGLIAANHVLYANEQVVKTANARIGSPEAPATIDLADPESTIAWANVFHRDSAASYDGFTDVTHAALRVRSP
jgi:hypothetical protein